MRTKPILSHPITLVGQYFVFISSPNYQVVNRIPYLTFTTNMLFIAHVILKLLSCMCTVRSKTALLIIPHATCVGAEFSCLEMCGRPIPLLGTVHIYNLTTIQNFPKTQMTIFEILKNHPLPKTITTLQSPNHPKPLVDQPQKTPQFNSQGRSSFYPISGGENDQHISETNQLEIQPPACYFIRPCV